MSIRTKLLMSLTAIALACSLSAAGAYGNRLRFDDDDFKMRFIGLNWAIAGGGGFASCAVTLLGRLHEVVVTKTAGSLIGTISLANVNDAGCPAGRARFLPEDLPWHLVYSNFTGRLPAITGIGVSIIGMGFQFTAGGITCLGRSTLIEPARASFSVEAGGRLSGFHMEGGARIDLNDVGGGMLCDLADSELNGSGTVEDGTDAISPRVTLI